MTEERLQKILARAGFGSRRASEQLVIAGQVVVNGHVAEIGSKADPEKDHITVDGRAIGKPEKPVYIALNKPRGVISDDEPNDPRPNILGLVPVKEHLFPVGRLDLESEGLVLLTNDGDMSEPAHPSSVRT